MLKLSVIKKAVYIALPTVVLLGAFFTFFFQPKLSFYKDKVRELNALNKYFIKQNDSLETKIEYIQKDMAKMDEIILTLYSENATLQTEMDSVNKRINHIKRKYEKSRIADDYNDSDIKRYFAELK